MLPVVFAVFANDTTQSLSLRMEKEMLRRIFNDRPKVELWTVENDNFHYICETII
jgi:hypothetical protein